MGYKPIRTKYGSHEPFELQVAANEVKHVSTIDKFGRNTAVGTTFVPVTLGGIYRTPQVSGATTLRVKAGNTNDSASGTGARAVTVIGLDANGDQQTEVLTTNGTSAGPAGSIQFIRVFRAFVSSSGTYATQSAGSHAAAIVVENSAGTQNWLTIGATGFPKGQTDIGVTSIPSGYAAFISRAYLFSDSAKTTEFIFFRRENILETAAPYTAMRAMFSGLVEGGAAILEFTHPIGPVTGPADMGFMAKIDVGTAQVTVNFEYTLVEIE